MERQKHQGELPTHLRRKGRKYRKRGATKDSRGIIKDRVSIDHRPSVVEKRSRFGDLEADLIIVKNQKGAIVTINDRASGMLKMKKVKTKQASEVSDTINELLDEWSPFLHTITSDNGKKFAWHQQVAKTLSIDYYFAHPYHPWERGSNENLNGLIRQYIPKKSDFSMLNEQQIKDIETKINNRPRKRHKYEIPIFVMNQLFFNQKVALMTSIQPRINSLNYQYISLIVMITNNLLLQRSYFGLFSPREFAYFQRHRIDNEVLFKLQELSG